MSKSNLHKLRRAANRAQGGVVYSRGSHPEPVIPQGEDLNTYIDNMSGSSSSLEDWKRLGTALITLGLSEAYRLWEDLKETKEKRPIEVERARARREMSW